MSSFIWGTFVACDVILSKTVLTFQIMNRQHFYAAPPIFLSFFDREQEFVIIIESQFDFVGVLLTLTRILSWGEDRRFDEMRDNLGKLAVFWIFQVLQHVLIFHQFDWRLELFLLATYWTSFIIFSWFLFLFLNPLLFSKCRLCGYGPWVYPWQLLTQANEILPFRLQILQDGLCGL